MTKYELVIFQAVNIPEKHEKKEDKEKELGGEKRGTAGGGGGMFSGFVQAFAGRSEKKDEHHEVNRQIL